MLKRVPLPGSERKQIPSSAPVSAPDPNELVYVSVLVRRQNKLPPHTRDPITREAFTARYGADNVDIRRVQEFAGQNDLTVTQADIPRRTVVLSGTLANMAEAFGTDLENLRIFQTPQGKFRGRTGMLFVPDRLDGIVQGVFGLDERRQARVRLRRRSAMHHAHAGSTAYRPDTVAQLYNFPAGTTGKGQTIAIIELGGGYRIFDVDTYFRQLGFETPPMVTSICVDGATNQATGDPNGDDGEVMLDIEVAGAVAPAASIVVYFAPNTDQGFLDAITTAVHDSINTPSVLSISWGAAESSWTEQALKAYDEAFREAALLGVTVCAASGDDGSHDSVEDRKVHVDFPASSPHVLACGGTSLHASDGRIAAEVVWNDTSGATGGGVSEVFVLPEYQAQSDVPVSLNNSAHKGRGVPDVAGDADPATGYELIVDGRAVVYGGTSAVAPLWAGLIARMNERLGKPLGFLNPVLYRDGIQAMHDITSGSNGRYKAGPGWDACTGLGSPDGEKLVAALAATNAT